MFTRRAPSLHKRGPVQHLSLTIDSLLLHKSTKLNESKENQGETLRIVSYFHWLFIRKSRLIMIRHSFLFFLFILFFFFSHKEEKSSFEIMYVCFVDEDERRGSSMFQFSPLCGHDRGSSFSNLSGLS